MDLLLAVVRVSRARAHNRRYGEFSFASGRFRRDASAAGRVQARGEAAYLGWFLAGLGPTLDFAFGFDLYFGVFLLRCVAYLG